MYSAIQYSGAATITEIFNDVVGLYTGSITSIGQLSANAVPAGSTITTTVAAGWVVDTAVSATDKVLKAPISDMAGQFKYVRLTVSGNNINLKYYEVYPTTEYGVAHMTGSSSSGATNPVLARTDSTNTLVCLSSSVNHLASANITNNLTTTQGQYFVTEHVRVAPWDTPANNIPPIVIYNGWVISSNVGTNNARNLIKPKAINSTGLETFLTSDQTDHQQFLRQGLTTMTTAFNPGTSFDQAPWYDSFVGLPTTIHTSVGTTVPYVTSLIGTGHLFSTGDFSAKSGIYLYSGQGSTLKTNDQITIDGQTFRLWRPIAGSYKMFAILEK